MGSVLAERALRDGLDALSPSERNQLLGDPAALSTLHWSVWTSSARHPSWGALIERPPARPRVTQAAARPVVDEHLTGAVVAASDASP